MFLSFDFFFKDNGTGIGIRANVDLKTSKSVRRMCDASCKAIPTVQSKSFLFVMVDDRNTVLPSVKLNCEFSTELN